MLKWTTFKQGKYPLCDFLRHVYRGEIMPLKVAIKKPVIKKGVTKKVKIRESIATCLPHIPNAATRKVLRNIRAGRNLIRYGSTEELFEDLGI